MNNKIYVIMKKRSSYDLHCRFFNEKEEAIEELKKMADKYDFVRWENENNLFHGFKNGKDKEEIFYIKEIEHE